MTPAVWILLAVNAAGWIFAAGGAWYMLKQLRRDLNGVGAKVNRQESKFMVFAILLLAGADDKDRELLADRLLDKLR